MKICSETLCFMLPISILLLTVFYLGIWLHGCYLLMYLLILLFSWFLLLTQSKVKSLISMGFVHLRHILIVLKGLLDGRSLSVRYLLNLAKMLQIHLLSHLLVDDAVSGHLYNIKVIDIFILLLNKVYSDAFPYVSLFEGHMEPQPSSSHSHNPLSPPLFINSS